MSEQANQLRSNVNTSIENMASDINAYIEQIRTLNVSIANVERGNTSKSDAVGLRDQRMTALEGLSKLIGVRSVEQADGTVAVYSGGDYLVYAGESRPVDVVRTNDRGLNIATIEIADINSPLNPSSGELRGLLDGRDKVLTGFMDKLDSYAGTLANEFNKVYSSGQGLVGFTRAVSQDPVDDPNVSLSKAGLTFTPQNGSFQIIVHNKQTGANKTTDIPVTLTGLGYDTTLGTVADSLNAISGVHAEINNGQLTITTTDPNSEFAFANDSSGVLASLGLNTFFTGSTAANIAVNNDVLQDPAKFAASRGGIGQDTLNAADLANFLDRPLASKNGESINAIFTRMTDDTTQGSAQAKSLATSASVFENTLRGQKLSTTSVNVDDEAIQMMSYQRCYQATAKYITTLNELLQMLVQI
jgi:flagellar hook-associated protein 1 FlgK